MENLRSEKLPPQVLNHENLYEKLSRAVALDWQQSFDGDLDYKAPPMQPSADAAVMILINQYEDEPNLVLTQRTEALRKHSGQVAFPGGRIDPEDESAWAAAVRETHEEIGMPLDHPIEKIGELSPHLTITGYQVRPFVAINHEPFVYYPEKGEVAEVFEIPISSLRSENFEIESQQWRGSRRHYFVLPHDQYYIWGATARMLHQLASRLEHVK